MSNLALVRGNLADPAKKQVQIEVAATSVNPIDLKRSAGYGQRLLAVKGAARFPLTLGNDFVGSVVAVGSNAKSFKIGDRVMGALPTGRLGGAHAQFINVDEDLVASAPIGFSDERLASLPYSFTTLWLALNAVRLNQDTARGKQVLINGASGAIGRMATRMLADWGAEISAVCSAPHIDDCLKLGAVHAFDRHTTSIAALKQSYDATLNFGSWADEAELVSRLNAEAMGAATICHALLENCDRLGLMGGLARSLFEYRGVRRRVRGVASGAFYQWIVFKPCSLALRALCDQLAARRLEPHIGFSGSLAEANAAFAHVAGGNQGKAILRPQDLIHTVHEFAAPRR